MIEEVKLQLVLQQLLIVATHGRQVELSAFIVDSELSVKDIEACWRVKSGRILDFKEHLVDGLGPVESWRDDRNRLRDPLELCQEVILAIADLFNCVSRSTFGLGSKFWFFAEVLSDHDLRGFKVVAFDSLVDASE